MTIYIDGIYGLSSGSTKAAGSCEVRNWAKRALRFSVAGFAIAANVAAASPPPPPSAHALSSYEESEDAVVRAFLRHRMSNKGSNSLCFNTTLGGHSLADLNALKHYPTPKNLTPHQKEYSKKYIIDMKIVLENTKENIFKSRVIETNKISWQDINSRQAKYEECRGIISYKIGRVIVHGDKAIIVGSVSLPCNSSMFGINFRKNNHLWEEVYFNGYFTVGKPGCGYFSKGNPGGVSDIFIMVGDGK